MVITGLSRRSFLMGALAAVLAAGPAREIHALTFTGNDIVYTCPKCEAKSSEAEFGSWNTFGGMFWSDCFSLAPMAPSPYIVARCWKCQAAFCKRTVKRIVVPTDIVNPDTCKPVKWIGEYAAIKEVLESEVAKSNDDVRLDLLVQIMWAANHGERLAAAGKDNELLKELKVETIPGRELRRHLQELSSMTNMPLWLKAELLRETKHFAEAGKCLKAFKTVQGENYANDKDFYDEIQKRIWAKDSRLFLMGED